MRRNLSLIGALVALGGLALALTRNAVGLPEWALIGGGGVVILAGVLVQGGRVGNALNAAKAALYTGLFLGCLVFGFLLLLPRLPKHDLTTVRLNSLTEVSRAFLRQLERPVHIEAFTYDTQEFARFFEMMRAENELITYEIFDPFADVEATRRYEQVYPGDVIVHVGERWRRTKGLEEGGIVNAIVAAMREGPTTIYFLAGHNEVVPTEPDNDQQKLRRMSGIVPLLQQRGFQVGMFELRRAGDVPEDAAAVAVVGPTLPLDDEEAALLRDYLHRGGRLLLALGPGDLEAARPMPIAHWRGLAADMGIELLDAVVLDALGKQMYGLALAAVPSFLARRNPIPDGNQDYASVAFQQSRAMRPMELPPPGTRVDTLLYSSEQSFLLEIAEIVAGNLSPTFEEEDAEAQPLVIRAEREFVQPGGDIATARMIVFGSFFPFTDAGANANSTRMFLRAVDELAQPGDLLPIPPRTLPDQVLVLSPEQLRFLVILHLLFVPGVLLFGGLGLTLRRRMNG